MIAEAIFAAVALVAVHDGDTITVNIPGLPPVFGEKIRVRVRGADSAELTSKVSCEVKKAVEAREFVRRMVSGKKLTLKNVWRDKYFRLLATVEVDGRSVGDELIRSGLAVPYDGLNKRHVKWCGQKPVIQQ
jgi:endonuclease YncB( thermonuclease family)